MSIAVIFDKLLNLNRKQLDRVHKTTRFIVQLVFFIFFPSIYSSAFTGIKYIFTQLGVSGAMEFTPFVKILIMVCAFTVIFGRFFCGMACAFGALGDWVHGIFKFIYKKITKRNFKEFPVLKPMFLLKYAILVIIAFMCFIGKYTITQGWSPWDVFSMIIAGNFKNLGGYIVGLILLVLIIIGMITQERFFCNYLCPMGATFAILPVLPYFALHRTRPECIRGCSACERVCPADIGLPEDGDAHVEGNCFQCQKCVGTCPKSHIHCGVSAIRSNEVWFTIMRMCMLLLLCVLLGI